jgi:uncharacterized protein YkwD
MLNLTKLLLFVIAVTFVPSFTQATENVTAEEQACIDVLNKERVRHRLKEVTINVEKQEITREWSRTMEKSGFRHAGKIIECIARNTQSSGEVAAKQWINSPPHRAVVLSSRFNAFSIGHSGHFFTLRAYNISKGEVIDETHPE